MVSLLILDCAFGFLCMRIVGFTPRVSSRASRTSACGTYVVFCHRDCVVMTVSQEQLDPQDHSGLQGHQASLEFQALRYETVWLQSQSCGHCHSLRRRRHHVQCTLICCSLQVIFCHSLRNFCDVEVIW